MTANEIKGKGAPSKGPAILLDNVKKSFDVKGRKQPVRALRGVTLSVNKGSMIAVKGDSGSGKTTLLQMIGALDLPTSGTVLVDGGDLSKQPEKELTSYRAQTVGFIFQHFHLIPNLTALENVELAMEALDVPKVERTRRAEELLHRVGMSERMDHKPSKLSGGEQQRVAIARALANDPAIILADEPTGNLDTKSGKAVIDLLDKLRREQGKTVVIVTHSDRASRACDRTVTINDGIIASEIRRDTSDEDRETKNIMRQTFTVSGKVVSKLFAADFCDFESIAEADDDDLGRVLGDKGLARKLIAKAQKVLDEAEAAEKADDDDGGTEDEAE
ncbi:MAG: ABC transporter ATP-binding protein [Thermoplasmata archaeon]|jgi:putative ABC transport system ATP-binding protein|nr:ABC transporter ATP-binding protein [Thermoplasmata archaeon]